MNNLETTYAGLKLKNPFIVSSSGLTDSAEKNKKWEEAGAAAVVLKSLFEEEIEAETYQMSQDAHAEEMDYLALYHRAHRLQSYLNLIEETKKACSIPVIASINCYRNADWTEFAKSIEMAGADALQLNIMSVCTDIDYSYGSFEKAHIEILEQVKSTVNIPVVVKIGSRFTNIIPLIQQLYANGAAAVVLFNRMVSPDINLNNLTYISGEALGHPSDFAEVLRWTGLVSARVPKMQLSASGGIADGTSIVKAILVGASTVEICSALYREGASFIADSLKFVEEWMKKNGYKSIEEFRALMNANKVGAIDTFERTQFFKNYTLRE